MYTLIWPFPEFKTPRSAHPGPHGNKLLPSTVSDDDDEDEDEDEDDGDDDDDDDDD